MKISESVEVRAGEIFVGGTAVSAVSDIDWDDPQEIPTVAAPGALPPGVGATILNLIASKAKRPLRYRGPYPTPALFRSLLRSFRTTATEAEFTRDVLARALAMASDEIPIDFTPAPHRRVDHAHGWSELRDGVERTVIDSISYEPNGSPARLVDNRAEVWFGDALYARVAEIAPDGTLAEGPNTMLACTSQVVGRAFPAQLRAGIAELVADLVPPPLAQDVQRMLATRSMTWADLGPRAARATDDGFELHAAIWERIAPLGLPRLALAIGEALAPVVTARVIAEVTTAR